MSAPIPKLGTHFKPWPAAPWTVAHCLSICLPIPPHHAYDGVAGIAGVDQLPLDDRAQRFLGLGGAIS